MHMCVPVCVCCTSQLLRSSSSPKRRVLVARPCSNNLCDTCYDRLMNHSADGGLHVWSVLLWGEFVVVWWHYINYLLSKVCFVSRSPNSYVTDCGCCFCKPQGRLTLAALFYSVRCHWLLLVATKCVVKCYHLTERPTVPTGSSTWWQRWR